MIKYFNTIDLQIKANEGRNIISGNADKKWQFIQETVKVLSDLGSLPENSRNTLIDYATEKALVEFCRINQFYSFNLQAKTELRNIYCNLFDQISAGKQTPESIANEHYHKIGQWLLKSNPFAERLYPAAIDVIDPLVCSEYSPELQIEILNLNADQLLEPVLDIGCGKNAGLVNYLIKKGMNVQGIDRFSFNDSFLQNADWLEYDFGIDKWGTIMSNLGFSNHFQHHHLREDGNYLEYGKKYMEILTSLKIGGRFHYAPDLPFIEHYLENEKFYVEKYKIDQCQFQTSVITRIK